MDLLLQFVYVCVSMVSYARFLFVCLFVISPSFGVSRRLCFVVVAFPCSFTYISSLFFTGTVARFMNVLDVSKGRCV